VNRHLAQSGAFWSVLVGGLLLLAVGIWGGTAPAPDEAATPTPSTTPTPDPIAECSVRASVPGSQGSCQVEPVEENTATPPDTAPVTQASTVPPTSVNDAADGEQPFVFSFWFFWSAAILLGLMTWLATILPPRSRAWSWLAWIRSGRAARKWWAVILTLAIPLVLTIAAIARVFGVRWDLPTDSRDAFFTLAGILVVALALGLLTYVSMTALDLRSPSEGKLARAVALGALMGIVVAAGSLWFALWPVAPSLVDWCLIGAGALLVIRQMMKWSLRRDPGAIEVLALVDATGQELKVDALTAVMRERLARAGLFGPPLVPGGQLQQQLVDVVAESPLSQAKWLAKLAAAVQSVAFTSGRAYKISTTAHVREKTPSVVTVTVDINDRDSGAAYESYSCDASSAEEAVIRAVYHVYWWVWDRPDSKLSLEPWERWINRSGDGLRLYQAARDMESEATKEVADTYRAAAGFEPLNMIVRQRLGAIHETDQRFDEALTVYDGVVREWPFLAAPRYRLGAVLSNVVPLTSWLIALPATRREEVCSEVLNLAPEVDRGDEKQLAVALAGKAIEHFEDILRQGPHVSESGLPAGFLDLVRIAVEMTKVSAIVVKRVSPKDLSTETFAGDLTKAEQAAISLAKESVFDASSGPGWEVKYNQACFYSWLSRIENREENSGKAVELLVGVLRDPFSTLQQSWVLNDPDLALMSDEKTFKEFRRLFAEKEVNMGQGNDVPMRQSWELLGKWSGIMAAIWTERREETRDWKVVESEFEDWMKQERQVWMRLVELASDPTSDSLREAVREAIAKCDGATVHQARLKEPPSSDGGAVKGSGDTLLALWAHVGNAAKHADAVWGEREVTSKLTEARPWIEGALARWEELDEWAVRPTEPRPAGKFLVNMASMDK
jgi:hypothetical protein